MWTLLPCGKKYDDDGENMKTMANTTSDFCESPSGSTIRNLDLSSHFFFSQTTHFDTLRAFLSSHV